MFAIVPCGWVGGWVGGWEGGREGRREMKDGMRDGEGEEREGGRERFTNAPPYKHQVTCTLTISNFFSIS